MHSAKLAGRAVGKWKCPFDPSESLHKANGKWPQRGPGGAVGKAGWGNRPLYGESFHVRASSCPFFCLCVDYEENLPLFVFLVGFWRWSINFKVWRTEPSCVQSAFSNCDFGSPACCQQESRTLRLFFFFEARTLGGGSSVDRCKPKIVVLCFKESQPCIL